MKQVILLLSVALIILFAQLSAWGGGMLVQMPLAENELTTSLKLESPHKILPVILAYHPELTAITYEGSLKYCEYKDQLGMDINVEGITDEYVCEIVEKGFVSDTDGLRKYLARKIVAEKIDGYSVKYSEYASNMQLIGIGCLFIGGILAIVVFAILYFGTKTFPKCLFWYSVLSALSAFSYMVLSLISFTILPGMITKQLQASVNTGFENDLMEIVKPNIESAIRGLFIENAFIFGALAFVFSILAVLFYVMGMYFSKTEKGVKPKAEEKDKTTENKES